jgi:hypothetical protein
MQEMISKEMIAKIGALLVDVILPHLKAIQVSQAEQKAQWEHLIRNLEEFRAEMQIHLAEIRAECALCRQELEDAMVTLCDTNAEEETDAGSRKKKRIIH